MNQAKLSMFRGMTTIPEGFYRTDGTYIYIVGPLVVCGHDNGTDPQSGVCIWSVNTGLAHSYCAPRYVHNCDACRFLGRWLGLPNDTDTSEVVFDLYICRSSVLARYGDKGHQYQSAPRSLIAAHTPPLAEAYARGMRT